MKILLSFIATIFILISCSTKTEPENTSQIPQETENAVSPLVGKWENLSLIVRMKDSTLDVPEGQWENVMGFRPIVTTFEENGTFKSVYKTLEDSTFMSSNGTWSIDDDSLTLEQRGTKTNYHYIFFGDTILFKAFLDWDQDGLENDHYAGKQIKLSN